MSKDDRTLQLLPLPDELARERASEAALSEAPLAVQEWFDALADNAAADARLRDFLDELLPLPEGMEAEGEEPVEDEPCEAPPEIGAWLAATAHDPAAEARLAAYLDELVPAPDAPAWRWRRTAVAAVSGLLAAAGLLLAARMVQAPTPAEAELVQAHPAPVVEPAPAPQAPAPALAPALDTDVVLAEQLEEPGPDPALPEPVGVPELRPTSPAPAPRAVAEARPTERRPSSSPVTPPVGTPDTASPEPAPTPLRTAGDLLAEVRPWSGQVVAGVDLRLETGFGRLHGSQDAPELTLADGSTVLVDIDRAQVDSEFETFTVHTLSATVTVLGTRYEVSSEHGRTTVSTRRGLVKVECTDGRKILVAAGQSTTCSPEPDPRIIGHMEAMDRPQHPTTTPRLSMDAQYGVLLGLLHRTDAQDFLATTEIMLDRAIADQGYRRALEAARIDAMCELGWEEPARSAAEAWLQVDPDHALEGPSRVALLGCDR